MGVKRRKQSEGGKMSPPAKELRLDQQKTNGFICVRRKIGEDTIDRQSERGDLKAI